MKTFKILFAAVLFLAISTGVNVQAQPPLQDQATVEASARVFVPISITNTSPLQFGNIAQNTTASVLMDGGISNAGLLGSETSLGVFEISGDSRTETQISFSGMDNFSLNGPVGSDPLTVTAFWEYKTGEEDATPATNGTSYNLIDGEGTLTVGGDIVVGEALEGSYTGSVMITVEYTAL